MNTDDADELDLVSEDCSRLADEAARLAASPYPDAGEVAGLLSRLALRLVDVAQRLAYDARERETEPGDL